MLFSNNDVILQSEGGEGVIKGPKIAVILTVWPSFRKLIEAKHPKLRKPLNFGNHSSV